MYIAPLWLVKKNSCQKTLSAFLDDDHYFIQYHNDSCNLLQFRKPLSEKQKTLFLLWINANEFLI